MKNLGLNFLLCESKFVFFLLKWLKNSCCVRLKNNFEKIRKNWHLVTRSINSMKWGHPWWMLILCSKGFKNIRICSTMKKNSVIRKYSDNNELFNVIITKIVQNYCCNCDIDCSVEKWCWYCTRIVEYKTN